MPSITQLGLIFSAYLAAGRLGAVVTSLLSGITPLHTLAIVFLIDFFQIPVYGLLLEFMAVSGRIRQWVTKRWEKVKHRVARQRFLNRLGEYRRLTVVLVSSLPLTGCGVLSACVLAHMMRHSRLTGTLCVMTGSVLSTSLFIVLFYFPIRWFHGF